MLLAARALGLKTTLTTLYPAYEIVRGWEG